MFHDLDSTLQKVLDDPGIPTALALLLGAEISFITPDRNYPAKVNALTLNLFLFEVKENRELRDPAPIVEVRHGLSMRRQPPLRVDCTYLVTAWSKEADELQVKEEHHLLSQALLWLSRFPTIPNRYLQGALANPPYPPPAMAAQMDGKLNVGEFWSALGIPPRPAFTLMVTIHLDLVQEIEGPLVTTVLADALQGDEAATREQRILIGGQVFDAAGQPVAGAWVGLEPTGETQVTDGDGRFVFDSVRLGTGYTLRARKTGLGETTRPGMEIPSLSGEYNLRFS